LRGEAALAVDRVDAGDLGSLAGELVLEEAPAFVLELEGLAGVSELAGFAVDFLIGDVAGGRMLLRLPGVELAGLPAGVLGLTGRVLVRLPGVMVEALPRDVPGLGVMVLLGVLAGVLGLAVVELAVLAAAGLVVLLLLGVDDRDGREARRGALRRSASAACCSFLRLLSMSLWCGACDPMG
jgi:hypothetical protein